MTVNFDESNQHRHSCTHHNHNEGSERHLHNVHPYNEDAIAMRLEVAEKQCAAQGSRFTELRRQVYSLILRADKPLGAYDLIQYLQNMRQKDTSNKAKTVAPPTIYRTLEFLLAQGFIHQLSSINAFIPCCHPRNAHTAVFLICSLCQRVQECSTLPVQDIIGYAKKEVGFAVTHSVMELSGTCANCQSKIGA